MGQHEIALQPHLFEVARLLDWVERTAVAEGVSGETVFRVMLAIEEAVTNVIRHAFADLPSPHVLRVELEVDGETLTASVIDNGRPFDPSTVPEPDLTKPLGEREPGGLGVHLMRGVMDRIDYCRTDDLNRLTLIKRLAETPPVQTPGRGK